MVNNKNNIKPFNGEKYSVWKFRVRALLSELNILKVVDEEIPVEVDDTWKQADRSAMSVLIKHLGDSFLKYAAGDVSAHAIFQNLGAIYERRSLASQLAAHKRLITLKLLSEMTLSSHFIVFDEIVSQLFAAGAKMEEMNKVVYLLQTMPSSYNSVITAIETMSDDTLSLAFVKNKLLDFEIKLRNESTDTSKKVMSAVAKSNYNFNKNNRFKARKAQQKKMFKGKAKK